MKNILIACISYYGYDQKYKKDPFGNLTEIKPYTYTSEGISVEAHQTNEACLKFLMKKLDGCGGIDECICVESTNVQKDPFTMEHIRNAVKDYYTENRLKKMPHFKACPLSNLEEEQHRYDRALNKISQRIFQIAKDDSFINIYLDVAGGKRDNFILIQLLTKLLSFYGYGVHAYYADITRTSESSEKLGTIVNTDTLFVQMNTLDAVNEFVRHGTVSLLKQYLKNTGDSNVNQYINSLFDSMEQFENSVRFCDTDLSKKLEAVETNLSELEKIIAKAAPDTNADLYIINTMIPLFRKKFHIGAKQYSSSELNVMYWCLENGLIQQVLTIFNEKVREILIDDNFIEIDEAIHGEEIRKKQKISKNATIYSIKINYVLEKVFEKALKNDEMKTAYNLEKVKYIKQPYGAYLFCNELLPEGIWVNYIDLEQCRNILIACSFVSFVRNKVNHAADSNQYGGRAVYLYKHGIRNRDYVFSSLGRRNNAAINPEGFKNDIRRALGNIDNALRKKKESE